MANVMLPKYVPCTKQSPGSSIDWGNPLTKDLAYLGFGDPSGINFVNNSSSVDVNGQTPIPSPIGIGFNNDGSARYRTYPITPFSVPDSQVSIGAVFIPYSIYEEVICSVYQSGTSSRCQIQISGSGQWQVFTASGQLQASVFAVAGVPTNLSATFGMNETNGTKIFLNGSKILQGTLAATSGVYNSVTIGARRGLSGFGLYFNGVISLQAVWKRALTDAEHASFTSNPWQLFHQRTLTAVREEAVVEYKQPLRFEPNIDRNNLLTNGLVVVSIGPGSNSDPTVYTSINNPTIVNGPAGVEGFLTAANSQSWQSSDIDKIARAAPFTVLAIVRPTSKVNQAIFTAYASGTDYHELMLTNAGVITAISATGGTAAASSGDAYSAGELFTVAARFQESERSVFKNGINLGTNTVSKAPALATSNRWGVWNGTTERFGGGMALRLVWNRALTDAEIASISANPWQIFKPTAPNISTKENRKPIIRESNMLGTSKRKLSDVNLLKVLRKPMMKQPQIIPEINYENPVTRGLVIAVVPHLRNDIGSYKAFIPGTFTTAVGQDGIALRSNSSSNSHIYWSIPSKNYGASTTVMCMSLASIQGGQLRAAVSVGSSVSTQQFQRLGSGSPFDSLWAAYRSDQTVEMNSAVDSVWNGTSRCVACTTSPTEQKLFVDGILSSTRASLSNWNCTLDTFTVGAHQRNGTVTDRFDGDHYFAAFWERPLTDAEVLSISNNPWQLFRQSSNLPLLK